MHLKVAFDMDVDKQLRKLDARATDPARAAYVAHLKGLLLQSVAAGRPVLASEFIPMLDEEFS